MRRTYIATVLLCCCTIPAWAAHHEASWSLWDVHDNGSTQTVDHLLWQRFLDDYVVTNPDGINRVVYRQARRDGGRDNLGAYIEQLTGSDPRTLNKREQLAYWINLYNALTIEVVLRYPDTPTIKSMGDGLLTPLLRSGPWDDKLVTIAGQALTLNDIEHRILRPIWRDHRIHYVLNCASLGCPNLNKVAPGSNNLEQLLTKAENTYINHPRAVQLNGGVLQLSSLFDWYQVDFARDQAELLTYLAAHHDSLATAIASHHGDVVFAYDWNLNAQEGALPVLER